MIVDPLATVITYLNSRQELACLAGRVAAKHKFGLGIELPGDTASDTWPLDSQALRIQAAAGASDISTGRQILDLIATCYGPSQQDAMTVYQSLVSVCRVTERTIIQLAEHRALLYFLVVATPPTLGFEVIGSDNGVDFAQCTLRTAVAECSV